MVQTITRLGDFKGPQLMDELIAQVPTFQRVTVVEGQGRVADDDNGSVGTSRGQVEVTFADDIDPALVDAVLDAHVPIPDPPPRDFKAEMRAVTDLSGMKILLEEILHL